MVVSDILTVAISIRIPLGRFLNVGGNKEKSAKKMVCPEAPSPSTVTTKAFFVSDAVNVGFKRTETCVQTPGVPLLGIREEAKVWPELDFKETVKEPAKVEFVESL
jgi:hypothetical protein